MSIKKSSTSSKRTRGFFGAVVTAVIVSSLLMFGCSDDDDNGNGNGVDDLPVNGGGAFTNSATDAWVTCVDEDGDPTTCFGWMFRNGKVYSVAELDDEDMGMMFPGKWLQFEMGTYTTNVGNTITINFNEEWLEEMEVESVTFIYTLSNSNNRMTLHFEDGTREVYDRRTGLSFVTEDDFFVLMCEMAVDMGMYDDIEECMDDMENWMSKRRSLSRVRK